MMESVEFGSLFTFIRNGMNIKQDKEKHGFPITRIETIWNGEIDHRRVGYAGLSETQCSGWYLEQDDILFSHINSPEQVGKCALYQGQPEPLVHGMNLLCLRPDKRKVHPPFMIHLLRTVGFRSKLERFINRAVNQASASIGNLRSIEIEIPTLDEQRRIAVILDHVDAAPEATAGIGAA
jgi:type I restriction enzyme S subunit